jgi:hypothetical protein
VVFMLVRITGGAPEQATSHPTTGLAEPARRHILRRDWPSLRDTPPEGRARGSSITRVRQQKRSGLRTVVIAQTRAAHASGPGC